MFNEAFRKMVQAYFLDSLISRYKPYISTHNITHKFERIGPITVIIFNDINSPNTSSKTKCNNSRRVRRVINQYTVKHRLDRYKNNHHSASYTS